MLICLRNFSTFEELVCENSAFHTTLKEMAGGYGVVRKYVHQLIFCQWIARIMMSRKFQGIFQSYSVQSVKVGEAFFILYVAIVYIKPFSEKANPRH